MTPQVQNYGQTFLAVCHGAMIFGKFIGLIGFTKTVDFARHDGEDLSR